MYRFSDSQTTKTVSTKPQSNATVPTKTKITNDTTPSYKEVQEARASLRLLKSKMQPRSTNNYDYDEGQENSAYSKQPEAPTTIANSNYRKVFKPETTNKAPENTYQGTNQKIASKNLPQESFGSKGNDEYNKYDNNRVGLKTIDNNQKLAQHSDKGGFKGYQDDVVVPKSQTGNRGMPSTKANVADTEDRPIPTLKNRNQFEYEALDRPLTTQKQGFKEPFGNDVENRKSDEQNQRLIECPEGCGRKFNENALEKHVKVCKDVFQSKRKEFDSKAARKTDEQLELESHLKKGGKQKPTGKANPQQSKGSNVGEERAVKSNHNQQGKWKKQSETLRAGLKAARGEKLSVGEQVTLESAQDDLIPCDHCGRRFNEKAAEKHIPFCANKKKLDNVKTGNKPTTLNSKPSTAKPASNQGRRY